MTATNLAERYQLPVFIALDQAISQNLASIEPLDFEQVNVDRGKRLTAEDLAGGGDEEDGRRETN